jgi:hypothetical protein
MNEQGHRQMQSASSSTNSGAIAAEAERKRQEDALRTQKQQEEMRRREEEITRRRMEEKRRVEQDDAVKRQRDGKHGPMPSSSTSTASQYQLPTSAPSTLRAPTAVSSRPPSFLDSYPQAMPLESPTWYDGDSTDSEAVGGLWQNSRMGKQRGENHGMPARAPARRSVLLFFPGCSNFMSFGAVPYTHHPSQPHLLLRLTSRYAIRKSCHNTRNHKAMSPRCTRCSTQ